MQFSPLRFIHVLSTQVKLSIVHCHCSSWFSVF